MCRRLLGSIAGVFVLACGGGDHANSGSAQDAAPSSSVSSDKELSSLSEAEISQLNRDMETYATTQLASVDQTALCQYVGFYDSARVLLLRADTPPTDGSLRQACSSEANTCMQGSSRDASNSMVDSLSLPQLNTGAVSGCATTVAEYEKCFGDSTNAYLSRIKLVPKCIDLEEPAMETILNSIASLTYNDMYLCDAIASKCPHFGDTME